MKKEVRADAREMEKAIDSTVCRPTCSPYKGLHTKKVKGD
jgi:predicted secreted Zn-dependent protease